MEKDFNEIKEEIKKIIAGDRNSTLSLDDEDADRISFMTRANGDIGEEQHSQIDLRDAVSVRNKVTELYGDKVEAYVEIVDERVFLNVVMV